MPTSNIVSVPGSDYNFRESASIGKRQRDTQDGSLKIKKGYDY
ncbi:MAG: hypothetical protein ACJAXH_002093 [Colwellia sp.]|jgi:hypothetical protein